ncbi:MAG TPA: D-alanine--D-alanine ligase family protein [Anaerolineae bacterium]|nr:D-alanine--D-alanine ligase family protein [Anaerolineae bacterium]
MGKIRVGVVFGGKSSEHSVSLMSAQSVMAAVDRDKYEVIPIGISQGGRWLVTGDPMKALTLGKAEGEPPAGLLAEATSHSLVILDSSGQAVTALPAGPVDVIFPVLHGPYGEDGTLQGLLEMAGIPYVGAGVAASAVGMDKLLFKDVARAHGIPVVPFLPVKRVDWVRHAQAIMERVEEEIGYPCFVKPANLGSSVGISKAHHRSELLTALSDASRYDRKMVVEVAIDAREIEVGVLGNDEPIASVPGEIVPCNEFYDFAAKYLDGTSGLLIPAPIPEAVSDAIRQMAIKAYLAVDCAGMARADFLLDKGTGMVYLNEINTIPGFTPISMYPKLWEATGIPYGELVDRLIELALERHADKARSVTSSDSTGKGD